MIKSPPWKTAQHWDQQFGADVGSMLYTCINWMQNIGGGRVHMLHRKYLWWPDQNTCTPSPPPYHPPTMLTSCCLRLAEPLVWQVRCRKDTHPHHKLIFIVTLIITLIVSHFLINIAILMTIKHPWSLCDKGWKIVIRSRLFIDFCGMWVTKVIKKTHSAKYTH